MRSALAPRSAALVTNSAHTVRGRRSPRPRGGLIFSAAPAAGPSAEGVGVLAAGAASGAANSVRGAKVGERIGEHLENESDGSHELQQEIDAYVQPRLRIIATLMNTRSRLQRLVDAGESEASELDRRYDENEQVLVDQRHNVYRFQWNSLLGYQFLRDQRQEQVGLHKKATRLRRRAAIHRAEIAAIDRRIAVQESLIQWARGGFQGSQPPRR
jgi:hypothetical protein